MTITPLILLAGVTVVIVFWFESLRLREYVIRRCHSLCESAGFQFLDQSVALSSISLKRDRRDRWRVCRCYQFYVSENGSDRYRGRIILMGRHIEAVYLEGESGTTILHENTTLRLH